jgi:hypothetical protein
VSSITPSSQPQPTHLPAWPQPASSRAGMGVGAIIGIVVAAVIGLVVAGYLGLAL